MSLNIAERQPLLQNSTRNRSRPSSLSPGRRPSWSISPSSPSTPTTFYNNRRNVCKTRAASAAILLSLVFERIAFYGLIGNLVLFLNKDPLRWESYHAIDASLYFLGLCFATSWIGGLIADICLGRFKALVLSFLIYISGYILMPWMTAEMKPDAPQNQSLPGICKLPSDSSDNDGDDDTDPFDERCALLIYISLLLIAVGTGFVKANIAPFGSDQVAREGQQATLSFFNWFYWSINLGAFVGLAIITYIQQQHSFFYGYLASACCLGISSLLFVGGYCFYHVRAPSGSAILNIFGIIREACRRKRQHRQGLLFTSGSTSRSGAGQERDYPEERLSFLDYAQHRHGGMFHDSLVEDVKQLKKIFAVFAVLIPYWLVYFQMQTTFLIQGLHMRLVMPLTADIFNGSETAWINFRNVSGKEEHPQLVAAWFALFDVIMLIILLPLFDRIIYPWIERRTGSPVSISRRILVGMVFAAAAMVVAGVVEYFRLEAFWPYPDPCKNASINQMIGGTTYQAANLSILWQIPQYALIGLSEVFTSVAGLQFAVSVAPRSMKGIIMGLFYLFSGIGSFLGTAFISSLNSANVWFHAHDYGNINCRLPCTKKDHHVKESCHLDYYFYLLAGIEMLGALLFLLVAQVFQLDEHHRQSRTLSQSAGPSEGSGDVLVPEQNDPNQPRSIQRQSIEELPS